MVTQVTGDIQKTTNTHEIQYQPGAGAFIFGDRNKISQVLNNLLSNAIKFSPGAKMVLVRTELQDGGVRLSVEDSGIGILPENRQKVFQQFYRITGEKPSTFPGMGIGLYVSSEIIKKQGGKMWLESNVVKGSTFYTWLPLDYRKQNFSEFEL